MRKTVKCAVLILTASLVSACGAVSGFETARPTPLYNEVACTVATSLEKGTAAYEKVRIVGEHINGDEWWVTFPTRDQEQYRGLDGKIHAVNVPKYKILRRGEHRSINGVMCQCPDL